MKDLCPKCFKPNKANDDVVRVCNHEYPYCTCECHSTSVQPPLNNCLALSLADIVQGVQNGTIGLHEGKVMMLGREVIAATTIQSGKVQVLVKALQRMSDIQSGNGTLTWKGMVMLATSALDEFEHWPAYSKERS